MTCTVLLYKSQVSSVENVLLLYLFGNLKMLDCNLADTIVSLTVFVWVTFMYSSTRNTLVGVLLYLHVIIDFCPW